MGLACNVDSNFCEILRGLAQRRCTGATWCRAMSGVRLRTVSSWIGLRTKHEFSGWQLDDTTRSMKCHVAFTFTLSTMKSWSLRKCVKKLHFLELRLRSLLSQCWKCSHPWKNQSVKDIEKQFCIAKGLRKPRFWQRVIAVEWYLVQSLSSEQGTFLAELWSVGQILPARIRWNISVLVPWCTPNCPTLIKLRRVCMVGILNDANQCKTRPLFVRSLHGTTAKSIKKPNQLSVRKTPPGSATCLGCFNSQDKQPLMAALGRQYRAHVVFNSMVFKECAKSHCSSKLLVTFKGRHSHQDFFVSFSFVVVISKFSGKQSGAPHFS